MLNLTRFPRKIAFQSNVGLRGCVMDSVIAQGQIDDVRYANRLMKLEVLTVFKHVPEGSISPFTFTCSFPHMCSPSLPSLRRLRHRQRRRQKQISCKCGLRAVAIWTLVSFAHTAAMMHTSSSILVAIDSDAEVIQHVLISRYFTATAVVILLYDALLTLNEEVSSCRYSEDWYFSYPM